MLKISLLKLCWIWYHYLQEYIIGNIYTLGSSFYMHSEELYHFLIHLFHVLPPPTRLFHPPPNVGILQTDIRYLWAQYWTGGTTPFKWCEITAYKYCMSQGFWQRFKLFSIHLVILTVKNLIAVFFHRYIAFLLRKTKSITTHIKHLNTPFGRVLSLGCRASFYKNRMF